MFKINRLKLAAITLPILLGYTSCKTDRDLNRNLETEMGIIESTRKEYKTEYCVKSDGDTLYSLTTITISNSKVDLTEQLRNYQNQQELQKGESLGLAYPDGTSIR